MLPSYTKVRAPHYAPYLLGAVVYQGSAYALFEAEIASDAQLLRGDLRAKLHRETEFHANPSHQKKLFPP